MKTLSGLQWPHLLVGTLLERRNVQRNTAPTVGHDLARHIEHVVRYRGKSLAQTMGQDININNSNNNNSSNSSNNIRELHIFSLKTRGESM